MPTKNQLEKQIEDLTASLEKESSRPTGLTIQNRNIEMKNDAKEAVAEAVKEGMLALQSLDGGSHGIYFSGKEE